MYNYTFTKNGFTFKRVNKKTARNAYKNGLRVMLCPMNLRPCWPHYPELTIGTRKQQPAENEFNWRVDSFEGFNCINSETGYYAAFYIPVKTVDAFTGKAPTTETTNTVESYDYNFMK